MSGPGPSMHGAARDAPAPSARLGERLVQAGVVTREQVDDALRAQRLGRGRLGYHLVRVRGVSAAEIGDFLAAEMDAGRLPAPSPSTGRDARDLLPAWVAHLHNVYPLALAGEELLLGVPPAVGPRLVDVVASLTGLRVEPCVLPPRVLRRLVERDYLAGEAPDRPGTLRPLAGIPTFVVDCEVRGLHPVAPGLRTADLSAEAWWRSLLGELVSRRQRRWTVLPGGDGPRVRLGDEGSPVPLPASVEQPLRALLTRLAPALLNLRPGARTVARMGLLVRGRRPVVTVVAEHAEDGIRLEGALQEQRLVVGDVDDLFADLGAARDAIDELLHEGRGLVLACGPDGGGVRHVFRALAERVAEVRPGLAWVTDAVAASGSVDVRKASGDAEVARALQAASDSAELLVVEDLPGARSVERALLAAAHRPVLALLSAADAPAALAWLGRQGFGSALKTGLLRGIAGVAGVEPACECATPTRLPPDWRDRFALRGDVPPLVGATGCPACLSRPVLDLHPVLSWTEVAGTPLACTVDDERAVRRRLRADGDLSLAERTSGEAAARRGDARRLVDLFGGAEP